MTAGRPDKLTPNMHINIIEGVKSGASDSMVADLVGLANLTIHRWVQRGQEDIDNDIDSKYVKFCTDYKKAKAERDVRLVNIVECAAAESWQAAMRLLEARRASEFARNAAYRDPFDIKVDSREDLTRQLLQMVSDNKLTASEAVQLSKLRLDSDNTEYKTTFMDRLKALEAE